MKEEWVVDYIHNKYGRWGLDRYDPLRPTSVICKGM